MTVYDDASKFNREAMDNSLKSFSAMTRGFQQIAAESADFTKRSYERSSQFFEQLSQTTTMDRAMELQTEFARSSYETWIQQATKMGELYSDIAKESFKPFEAVMANGMTTVRSAA
ncbi:phasin family protein [Mangrovibrevibacter kandeliae]|uniref:phasin family protein n=1 Tax=Mangrovibrevibacter kandeliae TaxID=2968473 RepID=UPI0021174534|nr:MULTISPECIES: phasin family protein [unclassified Aurantimonas]MCQ8782555.1 phasin family protein [Aurantimonas sp. CSK15Z-1]MCW4114636.1 phasin family protein [Aurantimonas sp. MSK8Z-1]